MNWGSQQKSLKALAVLLAVSIGTAEMIAWVRRPPAPTNPPSKAYRMAVMKDLFALAKAESTFFSRKGRYTAIPADLKVPWPLTAGANTAVIHATDTSWTATLSERIYGIECVIAVGPPNPASVAAAYQKAKCR